MRVKVQLIVNPIESCDSCRASEQTSIDNTDKHIAILLLIR